MALKRTSSRYASKALGSVDSLSSSGASDGYQQHGQREDDRDGQIQEEGEGRRHQPEEGRKERRGRLRGDEEDLLRQYEIDEVLFDLGVVRGLDYYTGAVFNSTTSPWGPRARSVAAVPTP